MAKILQNAYGIREARIIIAQSPLPSGQYDYIVSLPDHQEEALQTAVKEKIWSGGKKEMHDADVLLLKIANSFAPGLQPAAPSHSLPPIFDRAGGKSNWITPRFPLSPSFWNSI